MESKDSTAEYAFTRLDLGTTDDYDQHDFPFAYYEAKDDFGRGCALIKATLDEMKEIRQLGIDLNENEDFIYNTRVGLDELKDQKEFLQGNLKSVNLWKRFRSKRALRLFLATSKRVWRETKNTSESIQREQQKLPEMRVMSSKELQALEVALPNGMNDEAKEAINGAARTIIEINPFEYNTIVSQLRDGDQAMSLANTESILSQYENDAGIDDGHRTNVASSELRCPTSPQIINNIHVYNWQNSVVATSSNFHGLTLNHGSRNRGASVTQEPAQ
ncbi:hypothetical protein JVU11DRAFT_11780 [Chiua virens]|nr:hypothetical protein JVU11DRAFT_11780 [Chiua virens]